MSELSHLLGRQIAAARSLAGIAQTELASLAGISIATLRRMEASEGPAAGLRNNVQAVRHALEARGIEFTHDGSPGVRLRASEAEIPNATE